MPEKKVEWRYEIASGYHISKEYAELLFQVIRDKFGGESPTWQQLLEEARKKTSPVHKLFDWNKTRAAEAHWQERAQYFSRAIKVFRLEIRGGKVITSPAVRLSIPVCFDGHKVTKYVSGQRFGDDPTDVSIVLDRIRSELRSWLNRYRDYVGFAEMFDPVIKAIEQVDKSFDGTLKNGRRQKKVG